MRRLTTEEREKIRELQEKGISDVEISKMLDLPYYTVYYQRPEVKERKREYYQRPEVRERVKKRMREYYQRPEVRERIREYYQRPEVRERIREYRREYYQRPEVKERKKRRDIQFEEFMNLVRRVEERGCIEGLSMYNDNLYVSILQSLKDTNYGKKHKQIANKTNIKVRELTWKLRRLKEEGLINYENKRYSLSDKGKHLCKYLFSELLLLESKQ